MRTFQWAILGSNQCLRTVSTSPAGAPANDAVEPFALRFEGSPGVPYAAVIRDWELIAEAVLVARAQDINARTIAKYELHLGHYADYLASARRRTLVSTSMLSQPSS